MSLRRAWSLLDEAAGLIQDEPGFESELEALHAMLDKIDKLQDAKRAQYINQFEPPDAA